MSYVFLVFIFIVLVILLTPITRYEGFHNLEDWDGGGIGDIAPYYNQMLMGQGEYAEVHTTDIHSRIPRVRLRDPNSRWSQSYL